MPQKPIPWPDAPHWAVDASYLGKFFILLALIGFIASVVGWWIQPKNPKLAWIGKTGLIVGTVSLFCAIITLGTLFATNQFEFNYVFEHGDVGTQFRYKIAGIWSGQEGSFLLWGCTSSLFCTLAAFGTGIYRRWFTIGAGMFLTSITSILLYETPFTLSLIHGHYINPGFGAGLTPSLENRWVVIHPPTIFSGFGSLTVAAAYGFSAMMTRNPVDYVKQLRPWAILSAAILGIGLCFGGFWAYETLGWGGFWMWDPVENVSFVPWLFSIVLLHGLIVQSAKKQWIGPNLVLAGLPFFAFAYGTFLTRSGFLANASVHSFVEMNHTALWILAGFSLASLFTYYTVYFRIGKPLAREYETNSPEEIAITRQKLYSSGMVLLGGLSAATAIGMSVPFILDLAGKPGKAVEASLYHQVLIWFFVPIMIGMGIAPFVTWRSMSRKDFFNRISNVLAFTVGGLGVVLVALRFMAWHGEMQGTMNFPFGIKFPEMPWMVFLLGLCEFVFVANVWRLCEMFRRSKLSVGGFIAHMGISILLAGMFISQGLQKENKLALAETDTVQGLGYQIKFLGMTHPEAYGLLKHDNEALFDMKAANDHFIAKPGLYYIRKSATNLEPVVWPFQEHRIFYDIYFTLGAPKIDTWDNPVAFKPGQTQDPDQDEIQVTYHRLKVVGPAGQAGTKFVALTTVKVLSPVNNQWSTYQVEPAIQLTSNGVREIDAPVGKAFVLSLNSIDAKTNEADLQMHFSEPIFPLELFYKPMVIFVWAGAVITFLGTALAAFYRRVPRPRKPRIKKDISGTLEENLDPAITVSQSLDSESLGSEAGKI